MNVTVNDLVSPGASVRVDGATTVVIPVIPVTDAVYVAAVAPTFVTLRLTVWTPARSPIAIDGTFRSLASVEYPRPVSAVHVAGLTPVVVPHRKASQSLNPLW